MAFGVKDVKRRILMVRTCAFLACALLPAACGCQTGETEKVTIAGQEFELEVVTTEAAIQRGFGGSRLFDSVYWADRLVLAHDPRVIVMFSGTNDIAGNQPKPAARIGALFEQFVERVRERAPQAVIVYIAISPTMARQRHLDLVLETNRLISSICSSDPTLHFVDAAASLLDPQGLPDARWFRTDGLHLNARGYARWTELIKPLVTRLHAEAMSRRTTFSR